ncbi:protein OBERON 4-like [Olea europaea var. sylvestris]|uniref:protein OBERON 4-like n=1 Tax=Olea europaea var. sylvestris TaxID=158386 RepID=UPI000C1D38FC|nr:protein OBERON 4-like [Olea europaea var. sylvestris]
MKKLRSSDNIESNGDKGITKDWGRREDDLSLHRSSSSRNRSFYYRYTESGKRGSSSSSSRYDDRESSRLVRKPKDYDFSSYGKRKNYNRHKDGNKRGILSSSPRDGYGKDGMNSCESSLGPRRDFPKGFRSERDRSGREGRVSSWWKFGAVKESDDGTGSDGSELVRGSREAEHVGKVKSPQGKSDVKSPAWSKDSRIEWSKSVVEVEICEDLPVESGVHGSEREEGELEPDPQPESLSNAVVMDESAVELNSQKELNSECNGENNVSQEKANFLSVKQEDASKVDDCVETEKIGLSKEDQEDLNKAMELPYCPDTSLQGTGEIGDENETIGSRGSSDEEARIEARCGDIEATCAMNPSASQDEQKGDKGMDLEVKEFDTEMDENERFKESEVPVIEPTGQDLKDKGKIVALLPKNNPHSAEGLEVEKLSKEDRESFEENEMQDLSTRGYEFFSTNPVKEQDKVEQSNHNQPKDENLALELSLSLPNVLLPSSAHNRGLGPRSPSHGRSAQSFPSTFHTNSDGLTMSMSFSGSQQFSHNPSCSLTNITFDYEKSVGSRPIFQGVDWKSLSSDENKNKVVPVSQGIGSKANGLQKHSQASRGNLSGQAVPKVPIELEKQLSFNTRLSGAHSVESHENGPQYGKARRQVTKEKDSDTLHRINYPDGEKQALVVVADFAESIITMIVSEPAESMAQRFNDIAEKHVACVKDFVHDIISNPAKQWQLSALQKELRNRSDIQLNVLMNLHRPQLEILVALKMGLQVFLKQNHDIPPSDLAEIFLNMRCRNLTCRSLLPVDECDCKICVQKNGFCRECMCLVCSKFDMASNTCSWVGCDVCLHWCHADCGLRESHIRNGNSGSGSQGTTEMQFYCVACDHPSEMFGFVKEVFQNFVKEWTAENLSRELEYLRRIFFASKDERGKQLHEIAIQMLSKLKNKAGLWEMQKQIMAFFSEADSLKPGNVSADTRKDVPRKIQEGLNRISGSGQGAAWLKSIHSEKAPHLENSVSLLPFFDRNRNDKYKSSLDLQTDVRKESASEELEGIVRIKQAEAKMFQTRADDATREAEALKRIAIAKKEEIEEAYASRIMKLRLAEAEEMRKQKVEELQACERAYQEYFSTKMRMETDIKHLLLKMETTRRTYRHN